MKRMTLIFLALILIISCSQNKKEKIEIGVILPLTGEVATYGQAVKKGIDMAIEVYDTLNNFKIIYEDSRAEKKTAINAIEKLNVQEVRFFIGDATSTVTYLIGPRIQAKKGILIVPIATGDRIKDIGDNIFMISPRNEKQTTAIYNFITMKYSDKKIGCLFKQNDYGVNIANTFLNFFNDSIYTQAYQEGQIDFRNLLIKFSSENVEIIFLPGNYLETGIILKQAKEINYNAIFIGTDGAYSPKLIEIAGDASEGFLLTMMPVNYQSKMYLEFKKKYINEYNTLPDIFSCYGYESAFIITKAIVESKNKTTEEVKKILNSSCFHSLTDTLRFDNNGEAEREYQIYTIKNGDFIPY
jgi:branched-chain amino acid transport system substrate-binding protein